MDESKREKIIDRIIKKTRKMDDVCTSIYLALSLRGKLRYNELFRTVNRLNPKQKSGKPFISKPTFDEHIKHLQKNKLLRVIKKGKQNTILSLGKDDMSLLSESLSGDFESSIFGANLDEFFKKNPEFEIIDRKEYYAKLPEEELEQKINLDLNLIFKTTLYALKAFVNYDLKIEFQDDTEFWEFVGDPLYRMLEKGIADNCRESIEYRTKFFEKVEAMLKKKKIFDGKLED
jgi:hypothetical protein